MRILVAEDEPVEAEGLRRRLETLGHAVDVVYDGEAAVAQAEAHHPDLIFLNLRMPRLDGIAAAKKIGARRRVPIIVVTGHVDPPLIARARKAGVTSHLIKPVGREDLERAIALALGRDRVPACAARSAA